jgi:hypothetical protein
VKRALLVVLALVAPATAGPRHKVIVLPIDGNADAATRTKLSQSVQRLARVIEGEVSPGNTTLTETAAAVGCDPEKPACIEQVRTTLGYDEIIYGTATKKDSDITVVVHRSAKSKEPRSVTATFGAKDPPEKVEPTLLPLFSAPTAATTTPPPPPPPPTEDKDKDKDKQPETTDQSTTQTQSQTATTTTAQADTGTQVTGTQDLTTQPEGKNHLRRNLALTAAGGGALMVLIGLGLWSSASSLQGDIDNHPTDSVEDLQDLVALEDKAQKRAIYGDIIVLGGLALGGYGGWILWKDHKAQHMSVTPTPTDGGAAVTFTFVGGNW